MLSTQQVLDVWDQASGKKSEAQTQLLLSLIESGTPAEPLSNLTIGERNHRLLELRQQLFGSKLEAYVECPKCDQALDLVFSTDQFGFDRARDLPAEQVIESGAITASVRLPNGHDLIALANIETAEEGRALLFSRCLSDLRKDGHAAKITELDEDDLSALETLIAELDPRMELLFDLNCPACANQWQAPLEVDVYLWHEFDTHARELLENIHLLARAYGWSESEILAMSEKRRRYYVERLLQ